MSIAYLAFFVQAICSGYWWQRFFFLLLCFGFVGGSDTNEKNVPMTHELEGHSMPFFELLGGSLLALGLSIWYCYEWLGISLRNASTPPWSWLRHLCQSRECRMLFRASETSVREGIDMLTKSSNFADLQGCDDRCRLSAFCPGESAFRLEHEDMDALSNIESHSKPCLSWTGHSLLSGPCTQCQQMYSSTRLEGSNCQDGCIRGFQARSQV